MSRADEDAVRRWVAEMVGGGDLDVAGEVFCPAVDGGRIVAMWGLEDTTARLCQLGPT